MKTRKTVEIDTEDMKWFNKAYPEASLSWLLGLLISNFRAIHEDTGVTPAKVARDSAKIVMEEENDS
jgi:hypothetical protein